MNNEIVYISDDISRIKKGLAINIDTKKTKRTIRVLDDRANEIL